MIDFIITNPHHHMAMFAPVCRWLTQHGYTNVRVVSLCELRGFDTPTVEIQTSGATPKKVIPFKLAKDSATRRTLKNSGSRRFPQDLLRSLLWHGVIRFGLAREANPALVILPNDSAYPYNLICKALLQDSIPFLLMQEGVRFELPTNGGQSAYGGGGASAVAAWGETSASYFRRVGVKEERIHIVGNPRLDALFQKDWGVEAANVEAEYGINLPALLYISNPIDQQGLCSTSRKYHNFVTFLRLATPFLETNAYSLIVKLHTGESLPDYQSLLSSVGLGSRVLLLKEAPLHPLLYLSKAVIVLSSTVGLEALLMNRPLGVLPVPGHGYMHDYVQEGAASSLYLDDTLSEQLRRLIDGREVSERDRETYLRNQVANFGSATEIAGSLAVRLAEQREGALT